MTEDLIEAEKFCIRKPNTNAGQTMSDISDDELVICSSRPALNDLRDSASEFGSLNQAEIVRARSRRSVSQLFPFSLLFHDVERKQV